MTKVHQGGVRRFTSRFTLIFWIKLISIKGGVPKISIKPYFAFLGQFLGHSAVPHHALQCRTMLCSAPPCYAVLHHALQCRTCTMCTWKLLRCRNSSTCSTCTHLAGTHAFFEHLLLFQHLRYFWACLSLFFWVFAQTHCTSVKHLYRPKVACTCLRL